MVQSAISISFLSKSYGSKPVLKKINLDVPAGSIFAFLGPNGAGKTTTIRCLMDFIRPDSGRADIFDLNANKESAKIKELVGCLAADGQLINNWTAAQHIDFYQDVKKDSNFKSKIYDDLGLDPKTPVKHLSTGNKQKLGIILSLIGSRKLLILDEPTRGLDPLLQNEVYVILKDYVKKGGTVFIASHNLDEVERICTDIAIIREGEIVANKSLDDVRDVKTHLVNIVFADHQTDFKSVANTAVITKDNGKLSLKVHGDITPLLKELAKHNLTDLEISHASLEDIFMDYYKK